jgi:hypothetical protein
MFVMAFSSLQVMGGVIIFLLLCWLSFCVAATMGANKAQREATERILQNPALSTSHLSSQTQLTGPLAIAMSTHEPELR